MTGLRSGAKVAVAVMSALVTVASTPFVEAGETTLYLKSGWFTWSEMINGSSFVKERGAMHALGLAHSDDVSLLTVGERFEVWGGNLDYDGHDLTGTFTLKSDTSYLGTREEVSLSARMPRQAAFSFEPLLALGHKFWVRTRSGEDWNIFYGKVGAAGEYVTGGASFFLKGGAILPIYTRNHVSLSDSGLQDVVLEPKQRVTSFAEGGIKTGAFTVSVEYEALEFGQSPKVPTHSLSSSQGSVVINGYAFQPASSSSNVSLKLSYTF
ncbi:MAG TPA: hypothetical protein VJ550_01575 [Geomonas sp.]|nr:hypothetical protein [Geomonas sp.]